MVGLALTQECIIRVEDRVFSLRRELVDAVLEDQFNPKACCPKCRHNLTLAEIIRGFKNDLTDITTKCPKCKHRVTSYLVHNPRHGWYMQLPFFGAMHTLSLLHGQEQFSPEELKKKVAVYRSAIVHFGSLKAAFKELGISYAFTETCSWKKKVVSFLGHLPDTMIAECVEVSASSVRRLRQTLDIKAFTRAPRVKMLARKRNKKTIE